MEEFLDTLQSGYDYTIEFRNPSWNTEAHGMLNHNLVTLIHTSWLIFTFSDYR